MVQQAFRIFSPEDHATSQHDRELIKNAFYLAPEPDLLLAEEFGLDPNEESFKEGKEKFRLHLLKNEIDIS